MSTTDKYSNMIILKEAADWDNWLTLIEAHLKRKECWEAVLPESERVDELGLPITISKKKRDEAFGIIVRYIDVSLLECTRDPATGRANTPEQLLTTLRDRFFLRGSGNNLISLKMELWGLTMPEGGAVATLIDQVNKLVQRLKTICNSNTEEEDKIVILLKALPPSYDIMRAQLDVKWATGQPLSYLETCKAVRLFETSAARKDMSGNGATSRDSAMYGAGERKPGNCHKCGKAGHWATECRGGGNSKNAVKKGACHQCNKVGHFKRDCPDLKRQNKTGEQRVFLADMPVSFVLDTGATSHIVKDTENLATATKISSHITGIGGQRAQATHEGVLKGFPGKALVVPSAQENILSVMQLTNNGWSASFCDSEAILMDQQGRKIRGTASGGGFFRVENEQVYMASNSQEKGTNDMVLWHHRLGHPNSARLREVCRQAGIDISEWPKEMPACNTCVQAKIGRSAVTRSTTRAEADSHLGKGARLDIDLIGPMEQPSHAGSMYAMQIVDRRTRMTWTLPLKYKSGAAAALANFLDDEMSKYGRVCEMIHPDRGGEFTGREFTTVCAERGIRIVYAASATPEHNGLVERKHRSTVESARCLLMSAGLDKKFWAEALVYATTLQNMLPTRGLPDKLSPWEHWTGEKPKLAGLRTFGCKTFYLAPGGRFGKKASIGIYLGPSAVTSGGAARVFNQETRRVVVTRDIKIMEDSTGRPASTEHASATGIEKRASPAAPDSGGDKRGDGYESEGYASDSDNDSDSDSEGEIADAGPSPGVSPIKQKRKASPTVESPDIARQKRRARLANELLIDMSDEGRAQEEAANIVLLAAGGDPATYEDAINGPDASKWKDSMRDELQSLAEQEVFDVVLREPGTRCVGAKWFYKVKTNEHNQPVRFKSRLVAKGFTQIEGIDYSDISAPVASKEAVRTALAMAASKGWVMEQFDVNTAYLNAPLEETIYMEAPAALIDLWGDKMTTKDLELLRTGKGVLRLKKALYGLKQSGRRWYETLRDYLRDECGLQPTKVEPCIFVGNGIVMPVYVDDSIVMGESQGHIDKLFSKLEGKFDIKRMGTPRHFLGWTIKKQDNGAIFIHQAGYIEHMKKQFQDGSSRAKATPMPSGAMLDSEGPPGDMDTYRTIIGSVLFAAIGTRPDISTAVSILSRSVQAPTKAHVAAARNIVGYLAATSTLGVSYPAEEELRLEVYCDASFAGDESGRKSRTGWVILINGAPVAWKSALQPVIAHSTAESEYIAMSDGAREAIYIKRLIEAMGGEIKGPIVIHEDNQTAKLMAQEVTTKRSKHIDIRYHHIRERVELGDIVIKDCRTEDQVADMLTKPLPKEQFTKLRGRIMVN